MADDMGRDGSDVRAERPRSAARPRGSHRATRTPRPAAVAERRDWRPVVSAATLGRCELAVYLFAAILLTMQVADDCASIIATAFGL